MKNFLPSDKEDSKKDWIKVAHQWINKYPSNIRNLVRKALLDEKLAAWKLILPSISQSRVLLVGSSYYGVALNFARTSKEVFLYDENLEMLKISKKLAFSGHLSNIKAIQGGTFSHMPFSSNTFDLVIINGIFNKKEETFNCSLKNINEQWINEIKRILKPDGILYIGVRNRFGYDRIFWSFKKKKSIVINFLGKIISSNSNNFNVWIYNENYLVNSIFYCNRLLIKAGLSFKRTYSLFPCLNEFSEINPIGYPISKKFSSSYNLKYKFKNFFYRSQIFAPAFGTVACSKTLDRPVYEKIWKKIIDELNEMDKKRFESLQIPHNLSVRGTQTVTMIAKYKNRDGGVFLYLPLTPISLERRKHSYKFLKHLRKIGPHISEMVNKTPEPLITGKYEGMTYFVESYIRGNQIKNKYSSKMTEKPYLEAAALIHRFHDATAEFVNISVVEFNEIFGKVIRKLAYFDPHPLSKKRIEVLGKWAESLVMGSRIPLVCLHGDYHLGNCKINSNGTIIGVLDWELAQYKGLPLLDLLHLWVCRKRILENLPLAQTISGFINGLIEGENLDPVFRPLIFKWKLRCSQIIGMTIIYWANYVIYNIDPLKFADPVWNKAIFSDVLNVFESVHKKTWDSHL